MSIKLYSVNLWGSHPDEDQDDCWTGDEFETKEEALKVFNAPFDHFPRYYHDSPFVEILGPDIEEVRATGAKPKSRRNDDEWEREHATQAAGTTTPWATSPPPIVLQAPRRSPGTIPANATSGPTAWHASS